jgi:hypothetical protein
MPTLQHLKQHFDLPILGSISYVPAQGDMVQNVKENTLWFTSLGLLVLLFVFMIWYFHIMMKRPDFSQIYQDFYFLLSSVI